MTARLRPNVFHILVTLAAGDRHGSAISREVLERTGGSVHLWPATLYRTLDSMVDSGLIEELTGAHHPEGASGRRRYYRMTPKGGEALARGAEDMAALAATALTRLGRADT